MSFTEFHMRQRGHVVFSNAFIPIGASELDALPGHAPPLYTTLEIGKDLVYGMAYLYNTPLFTEHQWRSRVTHYNKMIASRPVQQQQQGREQEQEQEQRRQSQSAVAEGANMNTVSRSDAQVEGLSGRQRDIVETIFDKPYHDTLIGIKVFVDDELVPDHYPTSRSLLNCTATIDASEAFSNWVCVPIVLIGFLNNFLLSNIALYRVLSLNFAEYMLRQPIASHGTDSLGPEAKKNGGEATDCSGESEQATRTFCVRIEVVYGCRSEMNFCTEYISRGSLQLVMTKQSKAALKSYEEKLRKLIQRSGFSRERVIPMDRLTLMSQQQGSRRCLFCKCPLEFTCTICGAQLCGTAMCVWQPFAGYPHGCSMHKAQI
ncbi:hypothetical protein DQ04_00101000 [Trypanosoma grayi]|uniref:hypothetical protein n=1 Tax=Trypanosoma grayi TaxID=71804 RepID=UPI0004F426C2|nr:hypothetical protein DQ04_00101000 [Trypanosoma grayi]KEG15333.1 hypothetical protein DQ04_00101000 [Trypanosoma grayi]